MEREGEGEWREGEKEMREEGRETVTDSETDRQIVTEGQSVTTRQMEQPRDNQTDTRTVTELGYMIRLIFYKIKRKNDYAWHAESLHHVTSA